MGWAGGRAGGAAGVLAPRDRHGGMGAQHSHSQQRPHSARALSSSARCAGGAASALSPYYPPPQPPPSRYAKPSFPYCCDAALSIVSCGGAAADAQVGQRAVGGSQGPGTRFRPSRVLIGGATGHGTAGVGAHLATHDFTPAGVGIGGFRRPIRTAGGEGMQARAYSQHEPVALKACSTAEPAATAPPPTTAAAAAESLHWVSSSDMGFGHGVVGVRAGNDGARSGPAEPPAPAASPEHVGTDPREVAEATRRLEEWVDVPERHSNASEPLNQPVATA